MKQTTAQANPSIATPLPEWLTGAPVTDPTPPKQSTSALHEQFDRLFEHLIDQITIGRSLASILENDARGIYVAEFLRYVKRSPEKASRLREAQEIHSEVRFSKIQDIAENALDSRMADSQIAAIGKQASAYDRKRFGDVKQVEITQNISILDAMAKARERVIAGTVLSIERDEGEA
jgi:hypothetical protein